MTYISRPEKDRRTALLLQQHGACALCGADMPTAHRMVYVTTQNAIICRRCGMFRSAVLAGADAGLTPQKLAEFHAREPAPDPAEAQTTTTKPTAKLTPQQLEARQSVINGDVPGMTLDDWERRLGVYGTDYARQHGLDTPTESGVMVVDGVPCVLVAGEWVPTDQAGNEEPGL